MFSKFRIVQPNYSDITTPQIFPYIFSTYHHTLIIDSMQ